MNAPTAPTPPAEVARTAFEAVATGDLDRLADLSHEDIVNDVLPIGERHGPAAVREYFQELRAAFPDLSLTVEDIISDAHGAAVKWHATGTFTGKPFQGVSPNGSRMDVRGVDFMEIDSGRVRRATMAYDGAEFARQIGMLPPRGSATDKAMLAAFNAKTGVAKRWRERKRPSHS